MFFLEMEIQFYLITQTIIFHEKKFLHCMFKFVHIRPAGQ